MNENKIKTCKVLSRSEHDLLVLERVSDGTEFTYQCAPCDSYMVGGVYYFADINDCLRSDAFAETPSGYYKMVVCAWCTPKARQAELEAAGKEHNFLISHGICPDCLAKMKEQISATKPTV